MKTNRFTLCDSDTAHLLFKSSVESQSYKVKILVVETEPQLIIEKNGAKIFNRIIKSVDDLKIFLEEQLYQFLKV